MGFEISSRVRASIGILILLFLGLLLLVIVAGKGRGDGPGAFGAADFIEYWSAGQVMFEGANPYDPAQLLPLQEQVGWPHAGPLRMWNPPWLLLWMFPFVLPPFSWGAVFWLLANLAILLLCSTLLWKWMAPDALRGKLYLAWPAVLLFSPAWLALGLGQVSSFSLLGIVLCLWFVRTNRDFLAGAAAALTTVKPHIVYLWLLLLAWEVVRGCRWRMAAGFVSFLGGSCALVLFIYPAAFSDYWSALQDPPLYWATPTPGTWLRQLFPSAPARLQYLPPLVTLLGVLAGLFLVCRSRKVRWVADSNFLVFLSVLTAAFGWSFDQVVLLGPFLAVFLAVMSGESDWKWRIGLAVPLLVYSGGHLLLNALRMDEASKIWLAWVLFGAYLLVRKQSRGAEELQAL